jgi:hypothetical protein
VRGEVRSRPRLLACLLALALDGPSCVLPHYDRSTDAASSDGGGPDGDVGDGSVASIGAGDGAQEAGGAEVDGVPPDTSASGDDGPARSADTADDASAGATTVDGAPARDDGPGDGREADQPDAGPARCPGPDPQYSFLDGFERYPEGKEVAGAEMSPWRTLVGAKRGAAVTSTWAMSCLRGLFIQSSGDGVYAPLQLPHLPAKLNIEMFYALETGGEKAAEFGLASTSGGILTKVFAVSPQGTNLVVSTPWSPKPTDVTANLQTSSINSFGRPPRNYIRIELDFCALEARIFVGPDRTAALVAIVPLGGTGPFDVFYLSGEARSTVIDDLALWTPGTIIDRSMLCTDQLLEMIRSPGSRCSGLAWDGAGLWMLDSNKTLYEIAHTQAPTTFDFQGNGLSWDGVGFWTKKESNIVRIHPGNILEDPGPSIFSNYGSEAQWHAGKFWTLSSLYSTIMLWTPAGAPGIDWHFNASNPSGLSVTDDAFYCAVGIWRNAADYDLGLAKYAHEGVEPLVVHNLTQLGLPTYKGNYSLATDGKTFWICDDTRFEIYRLSLP